MPTKAILVDEDLLLFEQKRMKRRLMHQKKATIVGTAKVLSYKDIIEAQ